MATYIHPTADVSPQAELGENVKVWHQAQIREGVKLGDNCIVGKGVYIDSGVQVGKNCKLQNGVSVYHGVTLEDGVFVGPQATFTNDLQPRAINADGSLKSGTDWQVAQTLVEQGAAIGANSTIVAGVTIGRWAMVGAGSVVTRDVPEHGLVYGNPARLHGYVSASGQKLAQVEDSDVDGMAVYRSADGKEELRLPVVKLETVAAKQPTTFLPAPYAVRLYILKHNVQTLLTTYHLLQQGEN